MSLKPRVFLSHSSKDKKFVRELNDTLVTHGVDTFLDERDISLGEDIPKKVYESLEACSHFCYVISKNSISSEWVKDELSTAKMLEKEAGKILILPIKIDSVAIPITVKSKRCADFSLEPHKSLRETQAFGLLMKILRPSYVWNDLTEPVSSSNLISLFRASMNFLDEVKWLRINLTQLSEGLHNPIKSGSMNLLYDRVIRRSDLANTKLDLLMLEMQRCSYLVKEESAKERLRALVTFNSELRASIESLPSKLNLLSHMADSLLKIVNIIEVFEACLFDVTRLILLPDIRSV